jgi:hypothetical protein
MRCNSHHAQRHSRYLRGLIALAALVFAVGIAACGQADLHGAPKVVGLTLPSAQQQLDAAGYTDSVKSDAMFGVVIPSHFTVCAEHSPVGHMVPLDVSKQC